MCPGWATSLQDCFYCLLLLLFEILTYVFEFDVLSTRTETVSVDLKFFETSSLKNYRTSRYRRN
jgi:hypothetical protein